MTHNKNQQKQTRRRKRKLKLLLRCFCFLFLSILVAGGIYHKLNPSQRNADTLAQQDNADEIQDDTATPTSLDEDDENTIPDNLTAENPLGNHETITPSTTAEPTPAVTGNPNSVTDVTPTNAPANNNNTTPELTPTPTEIATVTPTPQLTPSPTPEVNNNGDDNDVPAFSVSTWNLLLVNPWHLIPEDFSVDLVNVEDGHSVDARAADDLKAMLADARAAGLNPLICSSYRTQRKQETLYANKVQQYLNQGYSQADAEAKAGTWVALPGTSEHQTGLAVDLVAAHYTVLDYEQENTAEQKWLMQNSWKYGFILRYPNAKKEITGINYEPWHYRYVGKEIAKEIYELDVCLEEFLELMQE